MKNSYLRFSCLFAVFLCFMPSLGYAFSGFACHGYFCDKYIDTIHITMSHNSLATPSLVFSPNQHKSLAGQFQDGIRGFNLDLSNRNGHLWSYHGGKRWGYNPSQKIRELVAVLNQPKYRSEFIIVQLQDEMSDTSVVSSFVAQFGSLLITDFDSSKRLEYYVDANKRVLLATSNSRNVDASKGMHWTRSTIIENHFEWDGNCYFSGPATKERYPDSGKNARAPTLMNHFCGLTGNLAVSRSVNQDFRVLYGVRRVAAQSWSRGRVNIVMVDYYDVGSPFRAQNTIRDHGMNHGCWSDSRICGKGTTCWRCCNPSTYWYTKVFTACGKQPCIGGGKRCLAGTSCRSCCHGSKWVWRKFGHFCK